MRVVRSSVLFLLAVVLVPAGASAVHIVDQRQPAFDTTYEPLEIGGPNDRRYAQTFTVGIEGMMVEARLPVQCTSGILTVEIFEVVGDLPEPPPTLWLDRGLIEAASLPPVDPPVLRSIPLEELPPPPGARFSFGGGGFYAFPGRRLAMVISNPTGVCTLFRAVAGDPYTRGEAFFDERPTPRGWVPLDGTIEPSDDLSFETVMDGDPPSPPCETFGLTPNPIIPNFLPICRCLEDEFLLEQRCAMFHPSYFLIRTVPFPIIPGVEFEVSWTLVPLTDLNGDVEITDSMKGFQSLQKKPLVFRANHLKPGKSDTLRYNAVAGKEGTFAVDSVIRSPSPFKEPDLIRMQSLIEVEPPPKQ